VHFSKFLVYEIGHVDLKSEVKFYTGSSLVSVSAHAHWKWPKWLKTRSYCKNSGSVRNRARRT